MKVTKIPGLGRFGAFIDDLDLKNISDDEWMELGKNHLEQKVTIIRNTNVTPREFELLMMKWGVRSNLFFYRIVRDFVLARKELTDEDKIMLAYGEMMRPSEIHPTTRLSRITSIKDENGNNLGIYGRGLLDWHSDEGGQLAHTPSTAILGYKDMVGSSTEFCSTVDWYENQSESFRSELDDMIATHEFQMEKMSPHYKDGNDEKTSREIYLFSLKTVCPEPTELPLIQVGPGGHKGLNHSAGSLKGIKGMAKSESDKLFEYIDKTLFVPEYMYAHHYAADNDLLLMDNTTTTHRRVNGGDTRLAYKIHQDFSFLFKKYNINDYRYLTEPWASEYKREVADISRVIGEFDKMVERENNERKN